MTKITYYEILECPPCATHAELHNSYVALARAAHKNGDFAESFVMVTEAWGVLRETQQRLLYDRKLRLERAACAKCGGRGRSSGFVGKRYVRDTLCDGCAGKGFL